MNLSDLFVVLAIGSGLYAIVVALAGRRHFLLRGVNPYRGTWLVAAVSVLWVGLSLMRWEAGTWELPAWGHLFSQLVTDTPTPPRVKAASVALLFGLLLITLVVWCVATLPRDPSTFADPEDRKKAFRYYVSQLRGGLDFAVLEMGDGERLEEEANLRQIASFCHHLPKVKLADEVPRLRTPIDQVEFWRQAAQQIHARMNDLDALIEVAHHGHNHNLVFDTEYGGLFFRYVRLPDPREKVDTGLYLFGATLNQAEMTNGRAQQQFQLLLDALHHIDRAIRAV